MVDPLEAAAPRILRTRRLILRPPTSSDAAFHHELHSDGRLYGHAPWARTTDPAANRARFDTWLDRWREVGVDYWTVIDRRSGEPLGFAGVRLGDDGIANLYYRLAHDTHGRGLGREAARAVVTWASEWLPSHRVRAVVRDDNHASVATATSAGLVPGEPLHLADDPPELGPSRTLWLPKVRVQPAGAVDDTLRERMLDLWCAVNAAGGAVGFVGDAPREEVAATLDAALAPEAGLDKTLMTLMDHTGNLLGLAWWYRETAEKASHGATLMRFMVDPGWRGLNLGRVALAGMHAVARALPGLEMVELSYRSGLGLGRLYEEMG